MKANLLIILLLAAMLLAGCDHRNGIAAPPNGMEVIVSAETTVPGEVGRVKARKSKSERDNDTVYVSLRDSTNKVFGLRSMLEKSLTASGKSITANPSAASCIIQVQILAAQKADPNEARQAMQAKFGGPLPPVGTGAAIMIADIIFAPRVVPTASSSKQLLANTSARSVKERCMLRIGVLTPWAGRINPAIPIMSEKMAEAISETFNSTY